MKMLAANHQRLLLSAATKFHLTKPCLLHTAMSGALMIVLLTRAYPQFIQITFNFIASPKHGLSTNNVTTPTPFFSQTHFIL